MRAPRQTFCPPWKTYAAHAWVRDSPQGANERGTENATTPKAKEMRAPREALVVPPRPPKLRPMPQRCWIGNAYADEAAFQLDLTAWHAEAASRESQMKDRAAAQDKLRDRSNRKRGTDLESDSARRMRKRKEQRCALCPACGTHGELVSNRLCSCPLKVCRECLADLAEGVEEACPACNNQSESQRLRHQQWQKQQAEGTCCACIHPSSMPCGKLSMKSTTGASTFTGSVQTYVQAYRAAASGRIKSRIGMANVTI